MTTLVTGAAGHVGNNLVRALVERGEAVRAMVRPGGSRKALEGLAVEIASADLRDEASLRRALDGCERVYHAAALISIRDGDRDALVDVNVHGTRRLLRLCRRLGVRRVVHTSSFGAVGKNPDGPSDETFAPDPFEPAMDYERSKALAEYEVLREALRGLDAVIVNPTAVIGPHDHRPSMMGKTIVDFGLGRLRAYIPGAFDFVPMRDVVAGHLLAMACGRTGERYLLSGEVVTVDALMGWLEELTGRARPRLRLPPRAMLPLAVAKDWVERTCFPDRIPRFNEHSIRLLGSGRHATNAKARRELGLEPTSVRQAFAEAVADFRARGVLAGESRPPALAERPRPA